MRAAALMVLAAAALSSAPAVARTSDYSVSEAKFKEDADALHVSPFPALPEKGTADILLEDASKLDQQLKILGIYCRVWKVQNPLSNMVERVLSHYDRDGQLTRVEGRPLIRFRAESALSTMRCVEVKELKTRCIVRTAINGEATREEAGAAPRSERVTIDVEHEQDQGVCGALARGAALSGRNASIALVARLKELSER